jgi:hypothetical protein
LIRSQAWRVSIAAGSPSRAHSRTKPEHILVIGHYV